MIRSMTGYAQGSADLPGFRLDVAVRTVNHRWADVNLRMPHDLAPGEARLRRQVLGRVKRGRVDVTVRIEPLAGSDRPRLDRVLAEEAVAAARTLGEEFGVEGRLDVAALLGIPGLLAGAPLECRWDAELQQALETTLGAALAALDEERLREGRHLQQELQARVARMGELVVAMRSRAEKLPAAARERLIERLRGLAPEVVLDPTRLAQEAALLAERSDVTEELVRLDGHLEQATRLLGEPDGEPLGKRMDFLLQEIQRETNTVNSKASDLDLGRLALELKGEIEKVREQVQNVE